MYTYRVDNLTLALWIIAYSLLGATLILGFVCFIQNRRKEIFAFLMWHMNIFIVTVITLLSSLTRLGDHVFMVILLNTLLLIYLTVPALVHTINLRKFPLPAYLLIYLPVAISLNVVLALKIEVFPYFYYIWWVPLTVAMTLLMKSSPKIEGDAEGKKSFFKSILKVSYLSLGIPVFMNVFILVLSRTGLANDNTFPNIYAVFYCLYNIPGLIYFLNYQLARKNSRVPASAILEKLSGREQDIVRLLMQGKKYSEIGDELCISMSTVKKHTNNIYRKTGTSSARLLIRKLMQN